MNTCSEELYNLGSGADWHELMIPQRIMRPAHYAASASEQLDPRCSMQTYHRPNQLY